VQMQVDVLVRLLGNPEVVGRLDEVLAIGGGFPKLVAPAAASWASGANDRHRKH
jgi:hypothetical protein